MDNAQKAIMIGVGLFITIIIISAVLLVVNLGTGLVDDATSNLSSMSSSLQNQILQNYDGKIVSGTQVRSAIQQYMTSTDVSVVLVNGATTADTVGVAGIGARNLEGEKITINPGTGRASLTALDYSGADPGEDLPMTSFSNVDNAGTTYINTGSRYNAYVLRVDDAVVGIIFVPSTLVGDAEFTVND